MEFSSQESGVGCHFLLQGIFSTQGSNPGLLYCRLILYSLNHQGSPISMVISYSLVKFYGRDLDIIRQKLILNWVYFVKVTKNWRSMKVKVKSLRRVQLIVTPWTVALQAPLPMGFSKQEYWSGLSFFLQTIFLSQGWNLGLRHYTQILYHLATYMKGSSKNNWPLNFKF